MKITLKIIKLLLFLPITSAFLLHTIVYIFLKFLNSFHPRNFSSFAIQKPLDEMVLGNPQGEFFVRILLIFICSLEEFFNMISGFEYEF